MNDSFDISGMYGIPPRSESTVHCGNSPYMPMPDNSMQQGITTPQRNMYNRNGYMGTASQNMTSRYSNNGMVMQNPSAGLTSEDYQDLSMQNMPSTGQMNTGMTQMMPSAWQGGTTQNMAQSGTSGTVRPAPVPPNTNGNVVSLQGQSTEYLNGFLRTQTGKMVEVEFLIGSNNIVTKRGVLTEVGANYILIREDVTNDVIACDFYHINFVRFL